MGLEHACHDKRDERFSQYDIIRLALHVLGIVSRTERKDAIVDNLRAVADPLVGGFRGLRSSDW